MRSAKSYVGNNLCTDMLVQSLNELLAPHAQVGTKRRNGKADEERLILYAHIRSITSNGFASHYRPRLNKALLQQWRL